MTEPTSAWEGFDAWLDDIKREHSALGWYSSQPDPEETLDAWRS